MTQNSGMRLFLVRIAVTAGEAAIAGRRVGTARQGSRLNFLILVKNPTTMAPPGSGLAAAGSVDTCDRASSRQRVNETYINVLPFHLDMATGPEPFASQDVDKASEA